MFTGLTDHDAKRFGVEHLSETNVQHYLNERERYIKTAFRDYGGFLQSVSSMDNLMWRMIELRRTKNKREFHQHFKDLNMREYTEAMHTLSRLTKVKFEHEYDNYYCSYAESLRISSSRMLLSTTSDVMLHPFWTMIRTHLEENADPNFHQQVRFIQNHVFDHGEFFGYSAKALTETAELLKGKIEYLTESLQELIRTHEGLHLPWRKKLSKKDYQYLIEEIGRAITTEKERLQVCIENMVLCLQRTVSNCNIEDGDNVVATYINLLSYKLQDQNEIYPALIKRRYSIQSQDFADLHHWISKQGSPAQVSRLKNLRWFHNHSPMNNAVSVKPKLANSSTFPQLGNFARKCLGVKNISETLDDPLHLTYQVAKLNCCFDRALGYAIHSPAFYSNDNGNIITEFAPFVRLQNLKEGAAWKQITQFEALTESFEKEIEQYLLCYSLRERLKKQLFHRDSCDHCKELQLSLIDVKQIKIPYLKLKYLEHLLRLANKNPEVITLPYLEHMQIEFISISTLIPKNAVYGDIRLQDLCKQIETHLHLLKYNWHQRNGIGNEHYHRQRAEIFLDQARGATGLLDHKKLAKLRTKSIESNVIEEPDDRAVEQEAVIKIEQTLAAANAFDFTSMSNTQIKNHCDQMQRSLDSLLASANDQVRSNVVNSLILCLVQYLQNLCRIQNRTCFEAQKEKFDLIENFLDWNLANFDNVFLEECLKRTQKAFAEHQQQWKFLLELLRIQSQELIHYLTHQKVAHAKTISSRLNPGRISYSLFAPEKFDVNDERKYTPHKIAVMQ